MPVRRKTDSVSGSQVGVIPPDPYDVEAGGGGDGVAPATQGAPGRGEEGGEGATTLGEDATGSGGGPRESDDFADPAPQAASGESTTSFRRSYGSQPSMELQDGNQERFHSAMDLAALAASDENSSPTPGGEDEALSSVAESPPPVGMAHEDTAASGRDGVEAEVAGNGESETPGDMVGEAVRSSVVEVANGGGGGGGGGEEEGAATPPNRLESMLPPVFEHDEGGAERSARTKSHEVEAVEAAAAQAGSRSPVHGSDAATSPPTSPVGGPPLMSLCGDLIATHENGADETWARSVFDENLVTFDKFLANAPQVGGPPVHASRCCPANIELAP